MFRLRTAIATFALIVGLGSTSQAQVFNQFGGGFGLGAVPGVQLGFGGFQPGFGGQQFFGVGGFPYYGASSFYGAGIGAPYYAPYGYYGYYDYGHNHLHGVTGSIGLQIGGPF